jgi:hypothetical protein
MKRIILFGPIIFAIVLIALTIVQYDFMRGLGWHPINAPTFDWPSGLALGPYGIVMTATFIISGLLIALLALRLKADLNPARTSQAGSVLLILSHPSHSPPTRPFVPLPPPGMDVCMIYRLLRSD